MWYTAINGCISDNGCSYHFVIGHHWFIISGFCFENDGLFHIFCITNKILGLITDVSLIQFFDSWPMLYQWYNRGLLCITSVVTDKIIVKTPALQLKISPFVKYILLVAENQRKHHSPTRKHPYCGQWIVLIMFKIQILHSRHFCKPLCHMIVSLLSC